MNIFTAEDLLVTHDATLLVLRRLDLFDCHKVVFAILILHILNRIVASSYPGKFYRNGLTFSISN